MKLLQNILKINIITFIVLSMVGCQKESTTTTDPGITKPDSVKGEQLLLKLVNDIRSQGCNCGAERMPPAGPLAWSHLLEEASKEHSLDMDTNDFFSHDSSDGSSFSERISQTGFKWTSCGENIAMGYSTEEQVMSAWLNSPGHCKNIMNAKYKFMGAAKNGSYWTQDFAAQ